MKRSAKLLPTNLSAPDNWAALRHLGPYPLGSLKSVEPT
jgi:hypothetical protein